MEAVENRGIMFQFGTVEHRSLSLSNLVQADEVLHCSCLPLIMATQPGLVHLVQEEAGPIHADCFVNPRLSGLFQAIAAREGFHEGLGPEVLRVRFQVLRAAAYDGANDWRLVGVVCHIPGQILSQLLSCELFQSLPDVLQRIQLQFDQGEFGIVLGLPRNLCVQLHDFFVLLQDVRHLL